MATLLPPLPTHLVGHPRDGRGYPIPFTTFVDPKSGQPDFRVIDGDRFALCVERRRCALCGHPLGKGHAYFIGGPKCYKFGFFNDPAMHRDCATFALQVCPHLARPKVHYRCTDELTDFVTSKLVPDEKTEVFALMQTSGFTHTFDEQHGFIIHAHLPWSGVTWWQDGLIVPTPSPQN